MLKIWSARGLSNHRNCDSSLTNIYKSEPSLQSHISRPSNALEMLRVNHEIHFSPLFLHHRGFGCINFASAPMLSLLNLIPILRLNPWRPFAQSLQCLVYRRTTRHHGRVELLPPLPLPLHLRTHVDAQLKSNLIKSSVCGNCGPLISHPPQRSVRLHFSDDCSAMLTKCNII